MRAASKEKGSIIMEHYYITIGRQHGCGGRLIGKELADRLGIAYYDRDTITDMIAEDCGLSPEAVSGLMERRTSSLTDQSAGRTGLHLEDPDRQPACGPGLFCHRRHLRRLYPARPEESLKGLSVRGPGRAHGPHCQRLSRLRLSVGTETQGPRPKPGRLLPFLYLLQVG